MHQRHRSTMNPPSVCETKHPCELQFESLSGSGQTRTFPCDVSGHVNMNLLADHALYEYLYVRALIGREFSAPRVLASATG